MHTCISATLLAFFIVGSFGAFIARPTNIPPSLVAPSGFEPIYDLNGNGTQNYGCNATTNAWFLIAPAAILSDASGKALIDHFGGPSWQSIADGSLVKGGVLQTAADPNPTANIPWLLLKVVQSSGNGILTPVQFIQRLETHGGVAPAGTCNAGDAVNITYSAQYWFYVNATTTPATTSTSSAFALGASFLAVFASGLLSLL